MKIVVPMAGRGSRFTSHGIRTPKPLIQVAGRPMVAWALDSLAGIPASQIIFIALREHEERYGIVSLLKAMVDTQPEIVLLDKVTGGQLCTVLAAGASIDTSEDVLVSSSDTYVLSELGRDIVGRTSDCRGIISVAGLPGDHWSFARTDETGRVVEVAEKERISSHASTGLYYFSRGRDLVSAADELIRNREKTRGEYYVIPVYQKFIDRGWRVDISVAREVWDMGTPQALAKFEQHIAREGL